MPSKQKKSSTGYDNVDFSTPNYDTLTKLVEEMKFHIRTFDDFKTFNKIYIDFESFKVDMHWFKKEILHGNKQNWIDCEEYIAEHELYMPKLEKFLKENSPPEGGYFEEKLEELRKRSVASYDHCKGDLEDHKTNVIKDCLKKHKKLEEKAQKMLERIQDFMAKDAEQKTT